MVAVEYFDYNVAKQNCGIYYKSCCRVVCNVNGCWCHCDPCCIWVDDIESVIEMVKRRGKDDEFVRKLLRMRIMDVYQRPEEYRKCMDVVIAKMLEAVRAVYGNMID